MRGPRSTARASIGCAVGVWALLVASNAGRPSDTARGARARGGIFLATSDGRPRQTRNAEVAELIGATSVSMSAPEGHGLTGAGVRVGVWDEGHARASHVDLAGRIVERDLGGWVEHATHTTATVAGNGTGSADARGMAPAARVWAFDWLLDAVEMEASAAAIDVSSNAYGKTFGWGVNPNCPGTPTWWGAGGSREDAAFGRYGRDAAALDALVFRTDLLTVWPVGNERIDTGVASGVPHAHGGTCEALFADEHLQESTLQFGTLGGVAVAKNGLTVGAALDVARTALTPERVVPMDMSAFGPTADGRIKPELLAGGEAVRSASVAGDEAYVAMSGSSSATAATAGAAALVAEFLSLTPRGIELKALLIHTARDAGAPGPDYGAGYGLLDVQAAIDLIAQPLFHARTIDVLDEGERIEWTTLARAHTPLRVTLAWNDPPSEPSTGAGTASVLVNDLDLSLVASDGRVFRPWSLDPAHPDAPATRSGPNRADNVEIVDVDAGDNRVNGSWIVRVEAHGGLWRGLAQTFAIVSSLPLASLAPRTLDAPRHVDVSAVVGGPAPKPARAQLANLGRGVLTYHARSLTPWVTVSPTTGRAPVLLTIEVDTSGFARAGEYLGAVEVDSDDPAGPRRIGVVARVTCTPDCAGLACGSDPRCGEPCGRCAAGQMCENGACVAWRSICPQVDLASQLGPALIHGVPSADREAASCGGDDGTEVGLSWTAPEDGRFAFTTRGSDVDTVLYARAAMCGGEELACSDDSAGRTSAIAVELNAGQRVTLFVDSFDREGGGEFRLNAARASCPNVDLGTRVGQLVVRASTVGGIDELAGACGGEDSEDVAFAWAAPRTARYRFALFDPAYQAVIYVRDGNCDGSELGCSAATDVGPVEVNLTKGQSVVIIVDGREGRAGEFTLDVLDLDATCGAACDSAPGGVCACDASCIAAGDCCADACASCGRCRCDPDCQGRDCGDDGCGGDCGGCDPGLACSDGACVPDACAGVRCDPCSACEAGDCVPLAEGAHCEDDDLCTVLDVCRDGRCVGEPRSCNDGFACTEDRCDESTGRCEHVGLADCCEPAPPCEGSADCDAGPDNCLPRLGDAGVAQDADASVTGVPMAVASDGCGCGVPGRAPPNPATASLALACAAWILRRARAGGRRR